MANDIFTQETVDKLNASALTFNEVVTSRAGGVSSGAIIDQTLTPLGETTDTLKGRLDKLGVYVSGWTSTDGGTLNSPAQAFLNNTVGSDGFGNYYSWSGAYPSGGHVVAPGTDPAASGSGYTPRTDVVLRNDLESNGQTVDQIGMQTAIHHSGRAGYASLPRLVKAFIEYNDAAAPTIQILGHGSSVGNGASLPSPATQAPVMYLTQRLNARFNKLGNKTITGYNRSVDGSTLTNGPAALASALAEGITPKLTVLAFGMNDGGTAIYNAGQTYPFVYRRTVEMIEKAKASGSDVVVLTTPHPHSQRNTWSMPSGVAQIYPTSVAAPVADSALVPTVTNSIKNIDATGNGVVIPVSYRHMRVNEAMRRAAADCGVPVIDAEWYWFKAVGDNGEDALFNAGEILHPNLLGHQLSYWKAIDDFVESLTASVVSGNQQSDYQKRVVTGTESPAARNHLRQSEYATSEKILRVDDVAGTRGFEVDANGNITPIETLNSSWEWPRNIAKKLIYPGGAPVVRSYETMDIKLNSSASSTAYTTHTDGFTEITVKAVNSSLGHQVLKYAINNKSGTLTLQSVLNIGNAVATISASGENIVVTPNSANTNFYIEVKELYFSAS